MNYKKLFNELIPNQIYFDWASSSLKPTKVLNNTYKFIKSNYANTGRGNYPTAIKMTDTIENIRQNIANFINAKYSNQIIFNSGATMGLNQVAMMIRPTLHKNSVVIVSDLDHHSMRLVWENFAKSNLCKLWVCPIDKNGFLDLNALQNKINTDKNVSVVCISAISNVLGTKQNLTKLNTICKKLITIVDFAQLVAHEKPNVLDFSFACFSGHKMYADSGIGITYIKEPNKYNPIFFGGGMIKTIKNNNFILEDSPSKFEAGTLPISQIISLGYALDFINDLGYSNIQKHEQHISTLLIKELKTIKSIKFLNNNLTNESVISFNIENINPLDLSLLLGNKNICTRAGNHCATWIHKHLNINSSIRFSIGLGNSESDIDYTINTIKKAIKQLND